MDDEDLLEDMVSFLAVGMVMGLSHNLGREARFGCTHFADSPLGDSYLVGGFRRRNSRSLTFVIECEKVEGEG